MTISAQKMVDALKDALASNIGVRQITVDGQTISFADRQSMIDELKYWQTEAAKAKGRRNPFRGVNLGSAF